MKRLVIILHMFLAFVGCDREDHHSPVSALLGGTTQVPAPAQLTDVLLVCSGQSNMGAFYTFQDFPTHPRVTELDSAHRSPCAEAAMKIADARPTWHVFTTNDSVGGTAIAQWQPGQDLYTHMLMNIQKHKQGRKVIGFLWYQGESDARQNFDPDWNAHYLNMIHAIRSEINEPNMPVVFAQLGQINAEDQFPNWSVFKANQALIHEPYMDMIYTSDVPFVGNVHHDAAGDMLIGDRFAQALIPMLPEVH